MDRRLASLAARLRVWGLNGLAASVLESAGPLAFLGAQMLYIAGPAFSPFDLEDEVTALARLLEDPQAVQALAERLGEEPAA